MGSGQSKDKKDKKKDKGESPKRDPPKEKKDETPAEPAKPETPPQPPPEDEHSKPKVKESEDKIIPDIIDEDEAEVPHDDDRAPHVVEGQEFKMVMGRECHQTLDTRINKPETTEAPQVADGELWVDESFPYEVAMEGQEIVEWKRPGEFVENPVLFAEGTDRFDIGQGGAGTCWFLSILSALADRERLLKQVIVEDYKIGTDDYKGIFHCRFWKLGQWEDVYIDDCLPYRPDIKRQWGTFSVTNAHEMWTSLMEKALAKFHGSYFNVEGGSPGDAFVALTGGTAERTEHSKTRFAQLFPRIQNALSSGCILACSVPKEHDKKEGLVGGHAYTITGATTISYNGRKTQLLRVRNPWGKREGEWKGAWSDDSDEWNAVSEAVKEKLKVSGKGDGEFWIGRTGYMKYFKDTTICNFTPDFDQDGSQDNLDKTCIAFGEWLGPTAAGVDIPQKLDNPMFTFNIPKNFVEADGTLPVVIQLVQQRFVRRDNTLFPMRVDLYKIEGNFKKPKVSVVLDDLTNETTYFISANKSYRYRCTAGKYLLIPHTMQAGMERTFMIRLFASQALTIKKFEENPGMFLRRFEVQDHFKTNNPEDFKLEHHFGQWSGRNSGGQISNRTFEKNPQYAVTVTGSPAEVVLLLKQDLALTRLPIGITVYRVDGQRMPLDINYIYRHHGDKLIPPSSGHPFMQAYETATTYQLDPGTYSVIIFTDEPGVEKDYVLSICHRKESDIAIRGYNVFNNSISK